MNTRQFDDLLIDLYTCPAERARWPEILDRICAETHARSAVIQLLVKEDERAWSRWMARDSASEAAGAEHDRHMADAVNPRLQPGRQRTFSSARNVIRDRDLFLPGERAFVDLQERLAALRLGQFMCVGLSLPGGEHLALALHRDIDNRRDFDADEESFARRLVPHLRRAVSLSEQFDAAHARAHALEDALDTVRCAFVLCSPDARVSWANRAGARILARRERVWVSGERLTAPSVPETNALRQLIDEVARPKAATSSPPQHYLVLSHSCGGEPLHVMAHPIAGIDRSPQQRVLLILSEPNARPDLSADLIRRVFALSPAESRLAAALCNGQTVNQYALANGVTVGTARFQLKQVLAKTRARRQSDLVRQIYSSVIVQALPRGH